MRKLRVAIIGCGHIAQWMHIPYLRELDDRYDIVAACDLSAQTLQRVADFFQIPARYTDHEQLLREIQPDVCLIATHDHYEQALAAVEAGAHILVEKPMCWLLSEAEHLTRRAAELGRIVQVGYHKRYDPNYERGLELMQAADQRRLLYLRCVIGPNQRYVDDFWPGWRYQDLPPAPSVADKIREDLGDVPPAYISAYMLMGGLSTHTFSIFRGLYPEVPEVHGFHMTADGRGYSALLQTSDGLAVTMDTGLIDVKTFDEEMALFAHNHIVKINFPSPYLKNAATDVLLQSMNGNERIDQRFLASNEEAYKREWVALYHSVVDGAPVRTPATEGVMDVQLMRRLLEAARPPR
ncbi:MAG: Gfo/Idh/MocA family oxidoreductase [Chloroflexota bacterium]|nr:Gfo/Idh/MocA family oxidoreductase [Chloroflexota bacterium]